MAQRKRIEQFTQRSRRAAEIRGLSNPKAQASLLKDSCPSAAPERGRRTRAEWWDEDAIVAAIPAAMQGDDAAREMLGAAFLELSTKSYVAGRNGRDIGTYADDLISDAAAHCFLNIKSFNPARGSAFSYFRKIIGRRFFEEVRKLVRHVYPRDADGVVVSFKDINPRASGDFDDGDRSFNLSGDFRGDLSDTENRRLEMIDAARHRRDRRRPVQRVPRHLHSLVLQLVDTGCPIQKVARLAEATVAAVKRVIAEREDTTERKAA